MLSLVYCCTALSLTNIIGNVIAMASSTNIAWCFHCRINFFSSFCLAGQMLCFLVSYSMCHEHFFFHQGVATKLVFKQLTSGSVLLFQNDLLYLHLFFVPSCISVMPEREENLPRCMLFILVLFTQISTFYFVQTHVPL